MRRYIFTFASLLFGIVVLLVVVSRPLSAAESDVRINEVLVGNASINIDPDFTNYSSWIELHNPSGSTVDLAGYVLSSLPDGASTPDQYTLPGPATIPANGTLLIWVDEENVGFHTSFELDMDGGTIELLAPGGGIIDSVFLDEQGPDVSYGRSPDSGAQWKYFDVPTPDASNTTPGFDNLTFASPPVMSPPGGRYATAQAVTLSTTHPGATIHYTLDGSKPTAGSPAYDGTPIPVSATSVIRARTFAPDALTSATATHTYLIAETTNLTIVSIATDPAHMFDDQIGIYVVGTNGIAHCTKDVANWNQPWERPASFEVFETNGTRVISQDVGFEIHGNCTRKLDMKSFEIKSRKEYGDNDIDYAFFDEKPLTSYRRLILRTGGQDTPNTLLRDVLGQELTVGHMDNLDRQGYRPAILYINGQFWGIYALRDKIDEKFIENTYGLDEDTDFDALEERGEVIAGNATRWNEFYNYITTTDLSNPAAYAYVQTQMDVDQYINYIIAEIYAANTDWPHKNVRVWRSYEPGSRWRWMLYDLDSAFGNHFDTGIIHNTSKLALATTGKSAYHGAILVQLSQNPEFRAEFVQRFATHLNTTYAPNRVVGLIDQLSSTISPDMRRQIVLWRMPESRAFWDQQIEKLRAFGRGRPNAVWGQLKRHWKASKTTTLKVKTSGQGKVFVAGAPVPSNYSGKHFLKIPLTLLADPAQGYLFVKWLETGNVSPEIEITLNGTATYTAVFAPKPPPPPIVINELHYNPASAQGDDALFEFVELVNTGATATNLSGFSLSGVSFTFPSGASIAAGEYIVLAQTATTYAGNGYQVFGWDAGTGLENGGETIALLDPDGDTVDSVPYDDDSATGWPTTPDSGGPSLSLLDPSFNNTLAASWAASLAANGTPGAVNFP